MKIFVLFSAIISAACAATFTNRIVGGEIAEDGQFPYEVSLKFFGFHLCAGSIINDQWILTAAHCVADSQTEVLSIVAGSNKINQVGVKYLIEKTIMHEEYISDKNKTINDVGLIKLKTKITFTSKIQPIPLNRDYPQHGDKLIVSGWGYTSYPGAHSIDLKYLNLTAVDKESCQDSYKETRYKIYDTQLCAFSRDGEGACSGDSGSPLVYNGKVAGIASWVIPCGIGYPDVYTRVSEFVDWIQDKIDNN